MAEQPLLKRLWASWVSGLTGLKSRLPDTLQQRLSGLSNVALTGIVLGSLLLIGLLSSTLMSPRSTSAALATDSESVPADVEIEAIPDPAIIADIQAQVAAVGDQFAAGVLQSVQAEFLQSCLRVTVESQWYALSQAGQDQLANELWQRTQQLSFETLQIRDRDGKLIARNPVVGDEMVIFWR